MVRTLDDRLGLCTPAVRRQALAYAERRSAAPTRRRARPRDPHASNCLRVLAPRAGAPSGLVLVDPDGFRCDPAYDLGVVLRDWTGRLAEGGRAVLEAYADRVAERSGVDRARTWEWAFLERVSTGLYVSSFGGPRSGSASWAAPSCSSTERPSGPAGHPQRGQAAQEHGRTRHAQHPQRRPGPAPSTRLPARAAPVATPTTLAVARAVMVVVAHPAAPAARPARRR